MYWNDVYARDARTRVDAEERAYSNIKRISSVHYKKTHRTQPKHKPAKQPSAIWKMASNAVETVAVSAGKLADSNLPSKAATILSKPSTHTKLMLIIAAAFVITTITSINSFATSVPETQEMPMPEDIPAAEETQDYVHNGFDDIDHSELWQQVNASDFVCLDIDEKVDLIGAMAHDDELRTGVPAEVTAAQMIYESGWMESDLTQDYNNCFGIKASSEGYNWEGSTWYGNVAEMTTQEEYEVGELTTVVGGFRVYDSVWDSVCDHSAYLLNSGLYPGIDRPGITADEALDIIVDGGYATGSDYKPEMMKMIEIYDLERFGV